MIITIRKGTEKDFEAIFSLIKELAEFERAADKVTNSVERMKEEQEYFSTFVAEKEDGEVIGMALYYFSYYTWVGKSLYLDDLYVSKEFRGKGIGGKLLNKLFEIAREEKCKRVRWQVLNWNDPAIQFYKKCGATLDDEWLNCDFNENGIAEFNIDE